jgi:hypothetical protein
MLKKRELFFNDWKEKINFFLHRWKEVFIITYLIKVALMLLVMITNQKHLDAEHLYWIQWDSPHYLDIARDGYVTSGTEALWIVFYPLYPILIKIFGTIFQNFELTSVILSIIFSFAASIAFFELTLLDFSKKVALKSVWFLSIFPTAYFMQSAYTESLFLFLTILSIYLFRRQKFVSSGVTAAFSSATRVNGIFLSPLFLIEMIENIKQKNWYKAFFSLILSPVGLFTYLSINVYLYGDPFYFTKPLESNWYKKFAPPWEGISNLFASFPPITDYLYFAYFLEAASLIGAFIISFFVFFKIRKSYAVYMWINLLLFVSTSFVVSTPRYVLSLFPIFIVFGMIKNKFLFSIVSLLFMIGLIFFTLRFTNGEWAF